MLVVNGLALRFMSDLVMKMLFKTIICPITSLWFVSQRAALMWWKVRKDGFQAKISPEL